jgi:hypothetical protein
LAREVYDFVKKDGQAQGPGIKTLALMMDAHCKYLREDNNRLGTTR